MRTASEIIQSLDRLVRSAPSERPRDLSPGKTAGGAPEWHSFESRSWALGEVVRQALATNPVLRKSTEVQDALVRVVACVGLRRGRQSFVACLSYVGAKRVAPTIVPWLKDADIQGHVVGALLGMRSGDYTEQVAPLKASGHIWIRNLAKKYCERYRVEASPLGQPDPLRRAP